MGLGRGPTDDDGGFFVSTDFKCFYQESNCITWWNCGLIQDIVGSKIDEIFLYPYNTKINDLFLPGGPTEYFITMFLLSSNEG